MAERISFVQKENPAEEDINIIRNGLRTFNRKNWGNIGLKQYTIHIKNEENNNVGGSYFYIFGNWLEIEYVWIEEPYRKKGIGKRLLSEVEKIGKREGCTASCLNTLEFQAKPFYEKNGYRVVYTQKSIPASITKYYMEKEL